MEVEGKAAVVSGGASGIGRAAVLALVERGAKVVVADVDEDGGRLTVDMTGEEDGVAVFRRGALQFGCSTRLGISSAASNHPSRFTCKSAHFLVEPRGFEPLTSAVQRRQDSLPEVSGACKIPANRRILP